MNSNQKDDKDRDGEILTLDDTDSSNSNNNQTTTTTSEEEILAAINNKYSQEEIDDELQKKDAWNISLKNIEEHESPASLRETQAYNVRDSITDSKKQQQQINTQQTSSRDDAEASSIVLPTSNLQRRPNYRDNNPGALAIRGVGGHPSTATVQIGESPSSTAISNAILVDEVPAISQAEIITAIPSGDHQEASTTVSNIFRDKRVFCILIVLLLIIVILGAVLAAIFVNSDSNTNSETLQTPEPQITTSPILIPTAAPTKKFDYVKTLLEEFVDEETTEIAWNIKESSQSRALDWLVYDDALDYGEYDDTEVFVIVERYAVLVLLFALNIQLESWDLSLNPSENTCGWNFSQDTEEDNDGDTEEEDDDETDDDVSRQLTSESKGIFCTDNLHVSGIILSEMEMNGYIPSEIALLGDLVELILNANDLTGSLPQELFDLRNLEEMYLSDNALTGNLPSTFKEGNYNLRVLDLSENNLEGTLPPELFVNMPNLEFVFLASKNYSFTGTFPTEIGLLKAIIELDLGNNRLSGSLPTELAFLTNLRMLNLKENFGLNGMVPIEFSKLENLDFLHLEGTYLENLDESFCEISEEFEHFSSECGGDSPRVSCSCCTHCCTDGSCYLV